MHTGAQIATQGPTLTVEVAAKQSSGFCLFNDQRIATQRTTAEDFASQATSLSKYKETKDVSIKPSLTLPGRVAQSVTCLATDACLTADPGVASWIPARSHTFVEIDHEIISTVILLPSAESFKKGCCQLQAKVCARSTG